MTRVSIVGGGLMGAGIAQVFAVAGHPVRLFEPDASARESLPLRISSGLRSTGCDPAAIRNIQVMESLQDSVCDAEFVTEAAPERLSLKQELFRQIESLAPDDAIIASNSSVIPVGHITQGLGSAGRMVGTHWWNPAPLIPLVEVVQGERTTLDTVQRTMQLLRSVGKVPAHVQKDIPGFVANRLQHALWREAIAMVAAGVCDATTLDDCVKNSFGLRLAVLGPLENADLVGLDLTLDIHRTIIPELDRHAGPHEFLAGKVDAGELGFKTGQGFRRWNEADIAATRSRLTGHLVAAAANRKR
jgi:3-hydroxybutyryl-CoA dehydrogenase